ncbi:MAG: DUF937 domain-containing protein [Bacteroidetes bacterium]|nr:DUF937 domain-containing protein [Bacteroidota bacterium]
MADLLNLIQSQLGDNAIDLISNQIGANKSQTSSAVVSALPMIMQALNRNASNQNGAQALLNAVSKDHDGSVFDNLAGFIGNSQQGPGSGILKHVFGQKRNMVENVVSNTSGLNNQASGKLMEILAPIVLGQLGKQKKQGGLDVGGLMNLLSNTTRQQQKAHPKSTNLVNQLLDKDGDGNIQDDLTNMGLKALMGGFFKNRR